MDKQGLLNLTESLCMLISGFVYSQTFSIESTMLHLPLNL